MSNYIKKERNIRIVGLVLTIVTTILATRWVDWNIVDIGPRLGVIMALGGFILLVGVMITIIALAMFWPARWAHKTKVRKAFIIAAITIGVVSFLLVNDQMKANLLQAPWIEIIISLLALAVAIVWLWVLFSLTVLARLPLPKWQRKVKTTKRQDVVDSGITGIPRTGTTKPLPAVPGQQSA